MARRVRQGDLFRISATEYNRPLAAAYAPHRTATGYRLPGGAGPRTHLRNASTVRDHNKSGVVVPIGGMVDFETPLTDPTADSIELAGFVRDATIETVKPTEDEHSGRVGRRGDFTNCVNQPATPPPRVRRTEFIPLFEFDASE